MSAQNEPRPDAWSGERVAGWLRRASGLERQLAPVSDLLFEAAAVAPGEAVLDVGCGTGPTTLQAARRAGPQGRVTGLDVSAEMLAAAQTAIGAADGERAPVDWLEADAASWTPPTADQDRWDLVLSRFGVMFFDDPAAAVRALSAAARPDGRLAVAVWGRRTVSPLFEVSYRLATDVRAARGQHVEPQPEDSGPFSWHDAQWVGELLTGNGWRDARVAPHRVLLPFAGSVPPAEAAEMALDFGPTRMAMLGADDDTVAAVRAAITDAFAAHVDDAGHVVLEAQVRIVTARVAPQG